MFKTIQDALNWPGNILIFGWQSKKEAFYSVRLFSWVIFAAVTQDSLSPAPALPRPSCTGQEKGGGGADGWEGHPKEYVGQKNDLSRSKTGRCSDNLKDVSNNLVFFDICSVDLNVPSTSVEVPFFNVLRWWKILYCFPLVLVVLLQKTPRETGTCMKYCY